MAAKADPNPPELLRHADMINGDPAAYDRFREAVSSAIVPDCTAAYLAASAEWQGVRGHTGFCVAQLLKVLRCRK